MTEEILGYKCICNNLGRLVCKYCNIKDFIEKAKEEGFIRGWNTHLRACQQIKLESKEIQQKLKLQGNAPEGLNGTKCSSKEGKMKKKQMSISDQIKVASTWFFFGYISVIIMMYM